jgi:endonuclease YncB( thermonuclease family)
MQTLRFLILFLLVACTNVPATKETFTGKVVGVKEGDTIEILVNGEKRKVRLYAIDCPERKQAFGTKAKEFSSLLCFGKEVSVEGHGEDKYRRILGTVYVEGKNLNEELVKAGMAWHYKHYSDNQRLADLETAAREQKAGLWVDENPIPPWEFRRKHTISD